MNMRKVSDMRDRHRLLFSFVLVAALLALTWSLIPITFETNDDAFMMNFVSGGKTGKPEADTVFSLFLWGRIVSSLYAVNAGIPWYTLIFLGLIGLSLTTVCYCVVSSFPKAGGCLFCLLYFCMFLYYSVIVQYTVVSAYCGVAAVSLLMIGKKDEDRKHIIRNSIIIFFTFFAVNIRSRVGYLVLGNAAFAICLEILFCLLKVSDRQKIKKMLFSFFSICIVVVISMASNDIHESLEDWEDFREFNSERVSFTDYSKLDYESNRALFDKIGWSEEFYELVKRWFFMDESVNAETFRQINERNVHGSFRIGRSLLHDWFPKIEFQFKVWVLLLLFLLADAVIHRKGGYKRSIVSFLWLFVWYAEAQYFGYTGRVMERAFEAWTLLAVILSILGSAEDHQVKEEMTRSVIEGVIVPVLILALCLVCVWNPSGGYTKAEAFSLARSETKKTQADIEDYVMEHPKNIYIAGTSLSWDGGPWRVYKESQPYNLIFWGGSFYQSPLYHAQLKRIGVEHIYMDDFFKENVQFIAKERPDENLCSVMEEKFPGCTYEITDEEEGFIVYRFLRL